jgi:hypothetical protein
MNNLFEETKQKHGVTEAWGHTFLLGVCPATEGEYVLSEVMPRVRIIGIAMDAPAPALLPAYQ